MIVKLTIGHQKSMGHFGSQWEVVPKRAEETFPAEIFRQPRQDGDRDSIRLVDALTSRALTFAVCCDRWRRSGMLDQMGRMESPVSSDQRRRRFRLLQWGFRGGSPLCAYTK